MDGSISGLVLCGEEIDYSEKIPHFSGEHGRDNPPGIGSSGDGREDREWNPCYCGVVLLSIIV